MSELSSAPAATEYIERKKTRLRVFTPSGIIEGDHSHPPGVRLSDSLRNAVTGERYLMLTDVTIRSMAGDEIDGSVSSAPFVLINAAHANVLIPLEE
jgi:hypothetical protein